MALYYISCIITTKCAPPRKNCTYTRDTYRLEFSFLAPFLILKCVAHWHALALGGRGGGAGT